MSNSLDAIRRVVEAFERSDWSEIDVRWGDVRVHLSTSAPIDPRPTTPAPAAAVAHRPAGDDDLLAAASHRDHTTTVSAGPPPTGSHVVVSPSFGIFWRSPEPGRPPFADLGQTVDASATVCIVEVMKLMYHVKADVSGEVIAVWADNGVAVRKGQLLFAIAPSGSST